MISFCNVLKFDYYHGFNEQTLIDFINKSTNKNITYLESKNETEINEINETISKYYIPQHMPVLITLGIFQFIFIMFCIILLKTRSWNWISKSNLDNKKNAQVIYQFEKTLLLITTSFLGIWISELYILYHGQSGEDFGIIFGVISDALGIITVIPIFPSNNIIDVMFIREIVTIGIPTVLFLIILNVNTILCQLYISDNVVPRNNKKKLMILTKSSIISFLNFTKKIYKKFLKFLEEEPDLDLRTLSANEWKFRLKSEISLLGIINVKNVDNNENNAVISINNDEKTPKKENKEHCIEISFNAESDIMIQTNYPLPSDFEEGISSISSFPSPLMEYYYYEITILSNQNIDETIIAIGLASKNCSIDRLPGCDTHSVGFHSDEGRIFHNEGYTGSKYAVKWGEVNDVIGCGYYPSTGQVFFTVNGENLGIAYTGLFNTWYPTIGSNGVCSLKVNFGQEEFEYKEAHYGNIFCEADDNFDIRIAA
ncbi:concanavalin A-like lectin/glucanase domain-containing protein [Rhizophagus clarus]|uniref:Concanavalin A-like lectin/glucanase domain-containing protein n=1 Tax=Rhizophagus clarus TaxID=94130 RepID=A0A8H3QN24_9GLOM|nr:concanavalin A-like lectin/glucanase domain-containing protein [Rhizophagus clarus]